MEKVLKELVLVLKSIGDALMGKVNSSNNNNEEGGNADSKNLFLGYNIPDKLVYAEYTGENDEYQNPILNNVYFNSFQEAIQYFESQEKPAPSIFLTILYKDLTLDVRNCYASVTIERGKDEGQYYFNFILLGSTSFDEHPFTINGENYYRINENLNL